MTHYPHPSAGIGARRRPGFTLIELLVVIAIIAILAAILFPVFARAREQARSSACQSNLKQLATAIAMYVQDYDENMPFNYHYATAGTPPLWWWEDDVQPYVRNWNLFQCPSASPHVAYTFGRPAGQPNPLISDYKAYTISNWPAGSPWAGQRAPMVSCWTGGACSPVNIAIIEDVSGTIHLVDSRAAELWSYQHVDACRQVPGASGCANPPFNALRHNSGFNAVFVDGHVRHIKESRPGMWTIRAND